MSKSGLKLVCNVNIVNGNLKSKNSQDYAQKPQQNCTFMNSASEHHCSMHSTILYICRKLGIKAFIRPPRILSFIRRWMRRGKSMIKYSRLMMQVICLDLRQKFQGKVGKWGNLEPHLKVLTNEKRGRLKVVAFDRSPFKLFSLKFSTKSVQTPSCERPKTTQRTQSLSFEIKNCFPIAVLRRSFMKKSGKLTCHVVIQTSLLILRRRTKYR